MAKYSPREGGEGLLLVGSLLIVSPFVLLVPESCSWVAGRAVGLVVFFSFFLVWNLGGRVVRLGGCCDNERGWGGVERGCGFAGVNEGMRQWESGTG